MKPAKSTNKKYYRTIVSALLFAAFLALSIIASQLPYLMIDLHISSSVQNVNSPLFDNLMKFISEIGNGFNFPILVCGVSLALLFYKQIKISFFLLISTGLGAGIGSVIKDLVNRPRPDPELVNIFSVLPDKSFPSLHVLTYTVFFGFIYHLTSLKVHNSFFKVIIHATCLFFVFSIGISRIYLGVHWFSDVIGGYLLGLFFLNLSVKIFDLAEKT